MHIEKLSPSSFKQWSGCQQAWFISNQLSWRFEKKSASLGTIVHAVLETLAIIKKSQQDKESVADTEIGAVSNSNFDIDIITDEIYKLYTEKPELKELGWTDKEYKDVKKYVTKALTYNNESFNPLKRKIVATERYIKIPVDESWATLSSGKQLAITGIIDLVTDIGSNTLEIVDWKTGQPNTDFLTGAKIDTLFLKEDIQLRIYHYGCSKIYGEKNNYIFTLFFLQKGPITISFSPEDLDETKERIKKRFLEIHKTQIPKLTKSWKCTRFCDYGKNVWKKDGVPTPIQFLDNQITPIGEKMCICDMVTYETNRRGMQWVIDNMKYEI